VAGTAVPAPLIHTSGPDAAEHLRASEQVINLFIDALDLDVEAAQIANEAQLKALIVGGALEAAVQVAAVRYRVDSYQEQIRRIIGHDEGCAPHP
jgi:hypothetical protein